MLVMGCGGGSTGSSPQQNPVADQKQPRDADKTNTQTKSNSQTSTQAADNTTTQRNVPNNGTSNKQTKPGDKPRILGDLLDDEEFQIRRMSVDEDRIAANGIRKLTSKHLILYTDLPAAPAIDELPAVFDLAVPQWCKYFSVELAKVKDWKMNAFLMNDDQRFIAADVFPEEVHGFPHGYQRGYELWLYQQKTDYYRRHLLLHEGTHGFMNIHLGGIGPPWYGEGMAELLGTHRWENNKLTLRYNPKDKEEVPDWGRVRIIRDQFAAEKGLLLAQVFQFSPTAHRKVEPYAWSWAAAAFFDNHPSYQQRFRALHKRLKLNTAEFNQTFQASIKDDLVAIQEQWFLFIEEMDYGYDVARAAVDYKPGQQLAVGGTELKIRAERGWQSSGIHLEKGNTYKITASGRYQVGNDPKPWWCEPNGVTIDYYRKHPLGILTAAIRDDANPIPNGPYLSKSAAIGLGMEITPTWSGTLYLRINESPAHLDDNAGELTIHVVAPQ